MKIQIKNRYDSSVIYECEAASLREAVAKAVKEGISLEGASLVGAYLQGAYLRGADLRGANLYRAYLYGANLGGASLEGASLGGASLEGADLQEANLYGASLEGADLGRANLGGANIKKANLTEIKNDFFNRLTLAQNEIAGLFKAVVDGKINGSAYEGECACFVGTVANIRNERYDDLGIGLKPDSSSPTEKWFLAIKKGDTPENSQISEITAEWIREFAEEKGINLPQRKVI